jgi:hypothetical protein
MDQWKVHNSTCACLSSRKAQAEVALIRRRIPFIAFSLLAAVAQAGDQPASTRSPMRSHPIPHNPGESLVGVVVEYPLSVHNPLHRHAVSAFITAYVLEGAIRSQVDGAPPKSITPGSILSRDRRPSHDQ